MDVKVSNGARLGAGDSVVGIGDLEDLLGEPASLDCADDCRL